MKTDLPQKLDPAKISHYIYNHDDYNYACITFILQLFNDFLKFSQGRSVERLEQAKTEMASVVSTFIDTIVPAVIKHGRMNTKLKLPSDDKLNKSGKYKTPHV